MTTHGDCAGLSRGEALTLRFLENFRALGLHEPYRRLDIEWQFILEAAHLADADEHLPLDLGDVGVEGGRGQATADHDASVAAARPEVTAKAEGGFA